MFTYIEWNPKNPVRANFIFLPCLAHSYLKLISTFHWTIHCSTELSDYQSDGIDSQDSSVERLISPDVTRRMAELFDVAPSTAVGTATSSLFDVALSSSIKITVKMAAELG